MSNPNVDALNDITKTLIDSQKGYQKVAEVADENHALRAKFQKLSIERSDLITAFQTRVHEYGGEPVTDGGAAGAMHRAWTDFTSLFTSDEKAALEAVDDGEEYLAERAQSILKEKGLDAPAIELIQRAHNSARSGEKFADARS